MSKCICGRSKAATEAPLEPPVGTWVRDRHGGVARRYPDGWGTPGFYPLGKWEAMWEARGPLAECGPWGEEINL